MNLGTLAMSLPVPPDTRNSIEWAARAEDLGYESLWIAETGGPDPYIVAALAAQVTKKARIGTAVSPIYFRTPATIASLSGTLGQVAPGRFILGLGTSSHAMVENWHGQKFDKPLARMRETVEVVRAMLAGEKLKFEGKAIRTSGFRLLAPPPQPVPIYVGALRPPMLELAGEVGDGVIVNLFPPEALPKMLEHVAIGAKRSGRNPKPEIVCRHQVLVTDDEDMARNVFRSALTGYFATPVYNKFAAWYGFEEEAAMIEKGFKTGDRELTRKGMTNRLVDALSIFGPLEKCRERIAEYAAAGVTTAIISPMAMDPAVVKATFEGIPRG